MMIFSRVLFGLCATGFTILSGPGAKEAAAYDQWGLGCDAATPCHGDFRANNYVSRSDGQAWNTSLHSGHWGWVNSDCSTCHTSPSRTPVYLYSSDGGDNLSPIACLGCHGRDEGASISGAGLRQHHWNNGVTICGGCHSDDSDPTKFTPVGEVVLPPYYENPGNNHPNMPTHPCNLESLGYPEDIIGVADGGLDNNGDNIYDTAAPDCAPLVPVKPSTWGQIKAAYN